MYYGLIISGVRLSSVLFQDYRPNIGRLYKSFLSVFLVKSQRTTLATREVRPKTRTINVALPSKPAEPSTPARQSHSSHGPGLPQVSTPIPRPRVHGPSSTPVSPGPGLR